MPTWTLGEIMSNATSRIGRRSDIAASTVSLWANVAIQDVQLEVPQSVLEKIAVSSTSSGENRIDLPEDFLEPLTLAYSGDSAPASTRTLRRWSEEQVDAVGFESPGIPTQYVLYAGYMELHPSPSSAWSLQMRYRARGTDIVSTGSVPSLDTEWRFAAVLRTEQYLHEYLGNTDDAQVALMRYLTFVQSRKDLLARRQSAGGMRMSMPLRRGRTRRSETSFDFS